MDRMYEVESTIGYVLNYHNVGDADRRYRILTAEHGVIIIKATSVRKEKSKMRHYLQRFNLVSIDYIHGRVGYKVIGGEIVTRLRAEPAILGVIARVGEQIERLSQGEESSEELFGIFDDLMHMVNNDDEGMYHTYKTVLELWSKARVLRAFGYFDTSTVTGLPQELFETNILTQEQLASLSLEEKRLEKLVTEAVMQTML